MATDDDVVANLVALGLSSLARRDLALLVLRFAIPRKPQKAPLLRCA